MPNLDDIASGKATAGVIIAEFVTSDDASLFAKTKGEGFTVTGGINLPYAVRPIVTQWRDDQCPGFKASQYFSDTCELCGESEASH